jgi:hypothetical protein
VPLQVEENQNYQIKQVESTEGTFERTSTSFASYYFVQLTNLFSFRSFLVVVLRLFIHTKKTNKFCYFLWTYLSFSYNTLNYLLSNSSYFFICNKLLRVLLTKQYLVLHWTLKTIGTKFFYKSDSLKMNGRSIKQL